MLFQDEIPIPQKFQEQLREAFADGCQVARESVSHEEEVHRQSVDRSELLSRKMFFREHQRTVYYGREGQARAAVAALEAAARRELEAQCLLVTDFGKH